MPKGLLLIQQLYGKITLSFENGVENFEDLINAVEKYRKLACYEETLAESSDISQNYNEENFAQDIAINDSHNKQIVDSDDLLNQNTDTYAIEIEPDNATLLVYRGPNNINLWINQSFTLSSMSKHREAIDDITLKYLNKVLEIEPNYVAALINQGKTYRSLGRYQDSLNNFDKALELEPDNINIFNSRSCTYISMGKYDDSIADSTRALEIEQNNVAALSNREAAYNSMKFHDKVEADLKKAVKLDPNHVAVKTKLGLHYNAKGRYNKVISEANKVLKIDSYNTMRQIIIIERTLNEHDKERDDIKNAMEIMNNNDSPSLANQGEMCHT
ncbi:hypothetical protein C2G38_2194360 [Gigaspora rosea]|uniref:Uncharacterized protein n=1 Tax=Gigaspora rosea TaxID=44941 RepID=A0A397UYM7_9GLOM|nr:hypothetical protein C2G38_2194360 [Gigaspora rosea]